MAEDIPTPFSLGGKHLSGEREVFCVEDPNIRFRSIARAAQLLGVHPTRMSRAISWGQELLGRHWRVVNRGDHRRGGGLAC